MSRLLLTSLLIVALTSGCNSRATAPPVPQPVQEPTAEEKQQAPQADNGLNGKTLDEWIAELQDKDAEVRRQAASALTRARGDTKIALVSHLDKTFKHHDADVRQLSAYVLGNLSHPPEGSIRLLEGALRDKDAAVRRSAATALVQIGRAQPELLTPLLQSALVELDADVQRLAIYVLENVDPDGKKTGLIVTKELTAPTAVTTPTKKPAPAGLSLVDLREAEVFHDQAIALHVKQRIDDADQKMRRALSLVPTRATYKDYLAELDGLLPTYAIDQHALKASEFVEQSMESLVSYLVLPARSERDKARAIFRWIADRIAYDAEGVLAGQRGDNSAAGAFKNRKCVCEGYSKLFVELCKQAGLEAVLVTGEAKGVNLTGTREHHAWNAVQFEGKWHLLDVTWSAGGIDEEKRFHKRFADFFFCTPPDQFIFSHLPDDSKWQLLDEPISRQEIDDWLKVDYPLLKHGVPPDRLRTYLANKTAGGLVQCLDFPGPKVTIRNAPLLKQLRAGSHTFRIESAGIRDIAVIQGNDWQHLNKNANVFEGTVAVRKGELKIGVRAPSLYAVILKYTVD